MKASRALIVLFFALVSGLAAMLMGAQWMTARTAVGQKVIVAARDINLGAPIEASMLIEVPWTAETVPTGAYPEAQPLIGRVVTTALLRGEPVLESKLAPVGTRGGLSAVIPEGKRAITVKVNEVIGVAGFALPGNYVDVMVNAQDETRSAVSKIVLERIMVLAVAQEASRDETKPKVVSAVTLEVTPGEAEKLDLARSIGNLSLVLRNQIDKADSATGGMRVADLLRLRPDAVPQASPAAPAQPRRVVAQPRAPAPAPVAVEPPPIVVPVVSAPAPEPQRVEVIRGLQRTATDL